MISQTFSLPLRAVPSFLLRAGVLKTSPGLFAQWKEEGVKGEDLSADPLIVLGLEKAFLQASELPARRKNIFQPSPAASRLSLAEPQGVTGLKSIHKYLLLITYSHPHGPQPPCRVTQSQERPGAESLGQLKTTSLSPRNMLGGRGGGNQGNEDPPPQCWFRYKGSHLFAGGEPGLLFDGQE